MQIAAGEVNAEVKNGEVKDEKDPEDLEPQVGPVPEASGNLSEYLERKAIDKGRCYYLCYVVTKNLFSTLGTVFLVCGYAAFGGWLFSWLEEDTDLPGNVQLKTVMVRARVEELWQLTNELKNETTNEIEKEVWTNGTFKFLRNFRVAVFNITRNTHWNGISTEICTKAVESRTHCKNPAVIYQKTGWDFIGSLFFAVSLITTIGYGNITPKTETGRIVAMAYATLGIPITLLCLAMVGRMFAQLYRFLFAKILKQGTKNCRKFCCRKKKTTQTTVNMSSSWETGEANKPDVNNSSEQGKQPEGAGGNDALANGALVKEDGDREPDQRQEYDDNEDDSPLRVPLTITTLTIILYVYIGTVIFSIWKKDDGWTNIISSYFCFITLSTIGLGDFYLDNENPDQIPVAGVYLLVGLSLLSMCFDLLAVEMEGKVVDISIIFGITSHEAVEDDSSSDESEEEDDNPETKKPKESDALRTEV